MSAAALTSCEYLYLASVSEPDVNEVRVIVEEATVGDPPDPATLAEEQVPDLRDILAGARQIVHRPGCRIFELYWPRYVAYCVRNESFATKEPDTSVSVGGRLFSVYSRSTFLDYVEAATIAQHDYPGPFKHW